MLRLGGQPVSSVASRTPEHAGSAAEFIGPGVAAVSYRDLPRNASRILIAVPDTAIAQIVAVLAASDVEPGGLALHTSGARDMEDFAPLQAAGYRCGTLHPLQTIATPEQGCAVLQGATFAISGDAPALEWARSITSLLHGRAVVVPPDHRPLYHAAAVMASNYSIAFLDAASLLMAQATNTTPGEALRMIEPLTRASINNAFAHGTAEALTGPIERGNIDTVVLHLQALATAPDSIQRLYSAAGLHTIDVARRKGLAEPIAEQLQALLRRIS